MTVRRVAVASALFLGALSSSPTSFAQGLEHIQPAPSPLVLQSRGSFLVGGDSVLQTPAQLSYFTGQLPDTGGHATTNQMYVEYMVPVADNGIPVIMLHGATLTGKSYDTTPDGRMGWYEYFVRQSHPVYVPDQISRGRSGFDIATYNQVRAGKLPARLGGAVIMGHSQTGLLPLNALLANPAAAKVILLEPAGCQANQLTDEQIATLATVPILTVFGDHLDAVTGTMVSWRAAYNDCQALVDRLNSAGGNAEMLHPADIGIHGNSHMIMQDKNNLQIADLILQWIHRTQAAELEEAT